VMFIQNKMNFPTHLFDDVPNEQVGYIVKNQYVTRMVEGCNAVSVIILFMSFIFAFYKGIKTFVFVAASIIALYVMNVLRIVGLNIVTSDHPQYSKMSHDYLFPAVIYGSVVLLWLVWIKFFALKNENS